MRYVDAQFAGIFSQVLYRHAEIVSGAYKLRATQRGCGKNDDGTIAFRPLTETELLADSMAVMRRQIERMNEFAEHIGQSKCEDTE